MGTRVRAALATTAVVVVALVAACGDNGSNRSVAETADDGGGGAGGGAVSASVAAATAGRGDAATDADQLQASGGGGAPAAADEQAAGAPLPQGLGSAKIVKTAAIDLEVAEGSFDAAFSKVVTIAAANGGFVASSTSSSGGRGDRDDRQAAGSVVLRIPSENFDAARQQLIDLGDLRTQRVGGEDVGGQLTDLDARLRNLRSQEEAIRLLMTKASNVGETLEVQRQLSSVREQIERLAAEQARLADSVALSTLTVSLAEPGVTVHEGPGRSIAGAFRDALEGAQSVLAAVIIALGYVLPLGFLAGAAWLAVRPLIGRARREREPATASVSP